jgi:hypothetical protein
MSPFENDGRDSTSEPGTIGSRGTRSRDGVFRKGYRYVRSVSLETLQVSACLLLGGRASIGFGDEGVVLVDESPPPVPVGILYSYHGREGFKGRYELLETPLVVFIDIRISHGFDTWVFIGMER